MIIEEDFFEFKISKQLIISFETNPSLGTYQRNSVLCERINQNKHIPYKLKIFIGSLTFSKHPLMNEEERLIEEMKLLLNEYRQRVDQAYIPHYSKTLRLLEVERSVISN